LEQVLKKSSIVNKERLRKCFERKILVQMEAEAKEKAMKKQGKVLDKIEGR
jgi:hypothetical protein